MPKPGAFDKAKVKGSGGFGASKSGRFDGPKESCDYTPSASAYNAYVSIGEQLTKSAKKQAFVNGLKTNGGGKVAGFGSGSLCFFAPRLAPLAHEVLLPNLGSNTRR